MGICASITIRLPTDQTLVFAQHFVGPLNYNNSAPLISSYQVLCIMLSALYALFHLILPPIPGVMDYDFFYFADMQ